MAKSIWKLTSSEDLKKKINSNLDPNKPLIGLFPDWRKMQEEVILISQLNMVILQLF